MRWTALDANFAAATARELGRARTGRLRRSRGQFTRKKDILIGNDLQIGQEVQGKVVRVNSVGAVLDIGADRRGWLHVGDIRDGYVKNPRDELRPGERVRGRVTGVSTNEVHVTLVQDKAMFRGRPLSEFADGDEVEGTVTHTFGNKCFVDVGAMVEAYLGIEEVERAAMNQAIFKEMLPVGRRIRTKVLKALPNKLTLTWMPLKGDELEIGQEVQGIVTRLSKAGAYLDICADRPAWLHIGQLQDGFVGNVTDALSVNDEVVARVMAVTKQSVQVSMRNDLPMWSRRPLSDFEVGDVVEGEVVHTSSMAVFLDVGAMVDAYLPIEHVNEFGEQPKDLKALFKVGKRLEAKVWSSQPNKLSLTLRTDMRA